MINLFVKKDPRFHVSLNVKLTTLGSDPIKIHNIISLSDTEDLVTVMTCNEVFNLERPDTYFEKV